MICDASKRPGLGAAGSSSSRVAALKQVFLGGYLRYVLVTNLTLCLNQLKAPPEWPWAGRTTFCGPALESRCDARWHRLNFQPAACLGSRTFDRTFAPESTSSIALRPSSLLRRSTSRHILYNDAPGEHIRHTGRSPVQAALLGLRQLEVKPKAQIFDLPSLTQHDCSAIPITGALVHERSEMTKRETKGSLGAAATFSGSMPVIAMPCHPLWGRESWTTLQLCPSSYWYPSLSPDTPNAGTGRPFAQGRYDPLAPPKRQNYSTDSRASVLGLHIWRAFRHFPQRVRDGKRMAL